MIRLVVPTEDHEAAALEYRQEHFDAGEKVINGSALFDQIATYKEWLDRTRHEKQSDHRRLFSVASHTFFGVRKEDEKMIGMVQVRCELNNDFLRDYGGHIAYAVRPTERRKGYATEMLALALEHCRTLGLERVMIGCYTDNVASVKTIKNSGGVLKEEKPYLDGRPIYLFWIEL